MIATIARAPGITALSVGALGVGATYAASPDGGVGHLSSGEVASVILGGGALVAVAGAWASGTAANPAFRVGAGLIGAGLIAAGLHRARN